jgi:hypothetical protein
VLQRKGTIAIKKSISLLHTRNFKFVADINSIFEWHNVIGTGSHGTVFKASHKKWSNTVAIKIVNKERLT